MTEDLADIIKGERWDAVGAEAGFAIAAGIMAAINDEDVGEAMMQSIVDGATMAATAAWGPVAGAMVNVFGGALMDAMFGGKEQVGFIANGKAIDAAVKYWNDVIDTLQGFADLAGLAVDDILPKLQVRIFDTGETWIKIWDEYGNMTETQFHGAEAAMHWLTQTIAEGADFGERINALIAGATLRGNTLEEALELAQRLADIDRAALSAVERELDDVIQRFYDLREALERFNVDTEPAYDELIMDLQSMRDRILGIHKSEYEQRLDDARAFNERLQKLIDYARQQMEILRGTLGNAVLIAGGSMFALSTAAEIFAGNMLSTAGQFYAPLPTVPDEGGEGGQPGEGPKPRHPGAPFIPDPDAINAAIAQWERWIEMWEEMFIDLGDVPRGGSGDAAAERLREIAEITGELDEAMKELSQAGMSEFQIRLQEIEEETARLNELNERHLELTGEYYIALEDIVALERERVLALQNEGFLAISQRERTAAGINAQAEALAFLQSQLEAGVVSVYRLQVALIDLQRTNFVNLGGQLISFLDKYYKGEIDHAALRIQLEKIRWELELGNMELQLNMLENLGLITQWNADLMREGLDWMRANPPDWDAFFAPPPPSKSPTRKVEDQLRKELDKLLDQYRQAADARGQLQVLMDDFATALFLAQDYADVTVDMVTEIFQAAADVMWQTIIKPIIDYRDSLARKIALRVDPVDATNKLMADFMAAAARVLGGDETAVGDVTRLGEELLAQADAVFGSSQGFIDIQDEVLRVLDDIANSGVVLDADDVTLSITVPGQDELMNAVIFGHATTVFEIQTGNSISASNGAVLRDIRDLLGGEDGGDDQDHTQPHDRLAPGHYWHEWEIKESLESGEISAAHAWELMVQFGYA